MKTILLVDDSATIRNVLKSSMHNEFNILEAGNGEEALEVVKNGKIDFFLFDVNMPLMDGITLTGRIRAMPEYGQTPIVILTTESRSDKREQGKAAGANGWIVKPCDPGKLIEVIRKMI